MSNGNFIHFFRILDIENFLSGGFRYFKIILFTRKTQHTNKPFKLLSTTFTVLGSSPYQNNQSSLELSGHDKFSFNLCSAYWGECRQEQRMLFCRAFVKETSTGSSSGLSKEHGFPVYLHHFNPLTSAYNQLKRIKWLSKFDYPKELLCS